MVYLTWRSVSVEIRHPCKVMDTQNGYIKPASIVHKMMVNVP